MNTVDYQKLYSKTETANGLLLAGDIRFNNSILLSHLDGSMYFIRRAFYVVEEGYCIVYTEHHGFFIYGVDDVTGIENHPPSYKLTIAE